MLSFEGEQFKGASSIVQKLVVRFYLCSPQPSSTVADVWFSVVCVQSLPFGRVEHKVVTCDCQPTTAVNPQGILVAVSGTMVIDGGQPLKFAQSFFLVPDSSNPSNFWVHNDIFRLNLS